VCVYVGPAALYVTKYQAPARCCRQGFHQEAPLLADLMQGDVGVDDQELPRG